jgi:uncharacterized protein (TIGR03437 family)
MGATRTRAGFAYLVLALCAVAKDGPRYRIETVAGGAGDGDSGPAIQAQISPIQGIALDPAGNLYISDTDSHRVRRVDRYGIITTVAGTGEPGYGGDGGPARSARLNLPYGVAVDGSGTLYIADLGNNRVRRVSLDGVISTVAGNGSRADSESGKRAVDAALLAPRNLALDPAGNLYISEFEGHRIRKVDPSGAISTVAGNGTPGFSGDGGPAAAAQLNFPAGLAFDASGALYVADAGNSRVRALVPGGAIESRLGDRPDTALLAPISVAVDSYGTVYVTDAAPVVRAHTRAGYWYDFAGNGTAGFSGDGGSASLARLRAPRDLAQYGGSIYIADSTRVRAVDGMRAIRTVAGDGFANAVGDGGMATSARLSRPAAVALDAGGLIIADTGTQRVRRVDAGGRIATVAGTGLPGYEKEPAAAAATPLDTPGGVAVDSAGNIAIADTGNRRIRRVSPDGRIRTILNAAGANGGPEGVCADAGSVYVVDTPRHRILRLPANGAMEVAAGSGEPGDSGDGGPASVARLRLPAACAVTASGALYIADTLNHRVRRVNPDGSISTVAGTGAQGSSGDGGPAIGAKLNGPRGVAVDSDGNVLIADTGNHRLRQITPDGVINTIAGGDAPGFGGDGGAASEARLNNPSGLAIDPAGRLYVADRGNDRIRRLTRDENLPPDPGVETEITVLNAASLQPGPVAPGELVSIFGEGIGPKAGASGVLSGAPSETLAGMQVFFDGVPARLLYADAGQINAVAPSSLTGAGALWVETHRDGRRTGAAQVNRAVAVPALFRAVLNQNGSLNSESSPAARGQTALFYCTGAGYEAVRLLVSGLQAEVIEVTSAPGTPGLIQVKARIPSGFVSPGLSRAQIIAGGAASPEIEVWLK